MDTLVGQLVEIVGITRGLKVFDEREQKETEELVQLDDDDEEEETMAPSFSSCGSCMSWLQDRELYVVKTFGGHVVTVPEANLQQWSPPPAEEGGFDVAWPLDRSRTGKAMRFADSVVGALAEKGYCVIQTFMTKRQRADAWHSGQEQERYFFRMKQEVESGYMGFDSNNKIAWLQERREEQSNPDGLSYPEDEELDNKAFEESQLLFRDLATDIAPMTPAIGVTFSYIMNPFLRMSMTRNEEEDYLPESVRDMMQEEGSGWSGPLQEYIFFAKRRRLGLLHMIENKGGEIWFYPKDGSYLPGARRSMKIPATQNKILIFRHDIMDYSYQALGRSLALQTWLMQETGKSPAIKEMMVNLGQLGDSGQVVCNPGPEVPDGPKASIMSLTTRLPGEAWSPAQYWCMFCSGTDTCTQWPYTRWETEPYYEEGADAIATGKSYTCHGGFVSQDQITQFDNVFFGIDETEARSMIPGQKMSLEVGYECLVSSGFSSKTLKGRRMGLWFGDVGPDWHSFQTEWARFCPDVCPTTMGLSMSCATTAARIAHQFDIRGPVSSYDTACSASLVAMNPDNAEALVVGVNTLLGPGSFIGNCMATMLSHQGRSFTFNRSADGYQRGEGCGAVFVKMYQGDKQDEEDRVCALIGTATNQDGRSASLTAPNGPAQQQVIKKSMRFAGINPNTVSIAECHGTGTALGDPIEVGALMAVMHERKVPILKTSAKSNIAHLEAGAGIAGLTKCIMMINMGTAPPNCHFNLINPHLTIEGYPVYFDTEDENTWDTSCWICVDIDVGLSSLYCGVSSFGFGGTNSRADVYGWASKGHKAAVKANLPSHSLPRALHMGQKLYVSGSWDNFSSHKVMDGGRDGRYSVVVRVDESCCAEFQLSCSQDHKEIIHPLVPKADSSEQVVGPDYAGKGLNFFIDGKKDGVDPGQFYKIDFEWGDDKKTISWKPTDSDPSEMVEMALDDEM
ncbi:unnamed protein product [Durusdinium trenchii]|uniref:Ketosynthase family 3 (KS3) domain-containing protein n=1 Tax=Durusdinium trenchii TaxID=1381693 RepID=A0ABP0IFM1_9DINO